MSVPPQSMSLEDYRRQIRALPALTRAQWVAFPRYVETAHSWYKRLPLLGPGKRFVFYLDPGAGCDHVARRDGSWEAVSRDVQGFHHAAIPTRTYRDLYGHLAFANGRSLRSGALVVDGLRVETGFGALVIDEDGARRPVPEEIEAGAVRLTGMIHPFANQPHFWERIARTKPTPDLWPESSGGAVAFEQIQRRCRELVADESKIVWDREDRGVDAVFADLVEPERQRQRRRMRRAIRRLLDLLDLPCAP